MDTLVNGTKLSIIDLKTICDGNLNNKANISISISGTAEDDLFYMIPYKGHELNHLFFFGNEDLHNYRQEKDSNILSRIRVFVDTLICYKSSLHPLHVS